MPTASKHAHHSVLSIAMAVTLVACMASMPQPSTHTAGTPGHQPQSSQARTPSHESTEQPRATSRCNLKGTWTIGDDVFELDYNELGGLYIHDVAPNVKAMVFTMEKGADCDVTIMTLTNEVPGGTPDYIQRSYELLERNGEVRGTLTICTIGDDPKNACRPDDTTTHAVAGRFEPAGRRP